MGASICRVPDSTSVLSIRHRPGDCDGCLNVRERQHDHHSSVWRAVRNYMHRPRRNIFGISWTDLWHPYPWLHHVWWCSRAYKYMGVGSLSAIGSMAGKLRMFLSHADYTIRAQASWPVPSPAQLPRRPSLWRTENETSITINHCQMFTDQCQDTCCLRGGVFPVCSTLNTTHFAIFVSEYLVSIYAGCVV